MEKGELPSEMRVDEKEDGEKGPSPAFWFHQLDLAKKAEKIFLDDSKEAWREYLGGYQDQVSVKSQRETSARFPIFWSSIRTMQPALYSRTPEPISKRLLDSLEDNTARIASLIVERLAKYLIRATPFDRCMYSARDDMLLAGKAINKVEYEGELEYGEDEDGELPERIYWTQQQPPAPPPPQQQPGQPPMPPQAPPPPQWVNDRGEPLDDPSQLQQDENGDYFTLNQIKDESINVRPISYKDVRHNPNARHWEEVEWLAFRNLMTKSDVRERFGDEIAEKVSYTNKLESSEKDEKTTELSDVYATIWEIWDRESKKVFFVGEGYKDEYCDEKDDPFGLPGFFPCPPFLLGTLGPDSLYPIPDYIQLRPLIKQLHALADRIKRLIRATRRRGLYNNAIEELKKMASDTGEAEFIGVSNWDTIMKASQSDSLDNLVKFFPTEKIAESLNQMFEVNTQYKELFNEIYGIPDILRGTSDPNETLGAQQMKGKFASLRFASFQREFQRFVRDDIELMCDIALAKFEDQKLADIVGLQFMEQPDQQVFPIALGLLRERDERSIRIEIETDSTILMNEDEDVQQRNQLATSVMQGFSQITSAAQGNQAIISVGLQLLMYVVRGLPNGKIIEESLQQTATQMMQPPPPPPPDPNIALQQQQLQLQQQEMQAKAQKDQADTEVQQASLQLDGQKAAMDAKLKEAELQLDAQKHSETLASKQGELAMKSKLDQLELLHKTSTDAYDQKLDSMRVRIESVLAEAKVKEEAFYARLDQAKAIHDMVLAKHEALEAKAVPTKKLAQFHRDPAGNTTHIAVSEVPVDGVDTPQAQNLGNDIDNNLMGK